jgi:hypothetical protein
MKKIIQYFFFIILVGCTSTQNIDKTQPISIDSYGDESELTGKTYILLPYDSSISSNYLLFKELSFYVNKELDHKGYKLTQNFDSANCVVFLKYGTSSPQTFEKEVYIPIYGQTGISSSTTSGTGTLKYYPQKTEVNYTTETNYNSSFGVVGGRTIKTSETFYAHYMMLSVFDKQTLHLDFNKSIRWKLISKLVTKDHDLRRVFPLIVVGSDDYIGKNSFQNISSEVNLKDPRLNWLLQGTSLSDEKKVILSDDEKKIETYKASSYKLVKYKSISDFKEGEVTAFKSKYGEIIFGIILSTYENNINIKTFPSQGKPMTSSYHWKDLLKIDKP